MGSFMVKKLANSTTILQEKWCTQKVNSRERMRVLREEWAELRKPAWDGEALWDQHQENRAHRYLGPKQERQEAVIAEAREEWSQQWLVRGRESKLQAEQEIPNRCLLPLKLKPEDKALGWWVFRVQPRGSQSRPEKDAERMQLGWHDRNYPAQVVWHTFSEHDRCWTPDFVISLLEM